MVIGRSGVSFASAPRRLRETESIVNHAFSAVTGCDWDVMIAARLMSRPAAEAVIRYATEASLATDVEWPLLLRRLGFSLRYVAADGLTYETNEVYGSGMNDAEDADLSAWIFRLELAAEHLRVMRKEVARTSGEER